MTATPNPRQLIVLCDGTNNTATGGHEDTNLVHLLTQLQPTDAEQLVFYDPGVGNAGTLPGVTVADRLKRQWQRISGLAFGDGVYENVAQSYRFLAKNYRPGDDIYIFGFSRGAFTARSVAGMVNMFGLLSPAHLNMIDTLLSIYFSKRGLAGSAVQCQRDATVAQLRQLLAAPACRDVWVHFVGVWDTVASIGIPPFDRQITGSPRLFNVDGSPKRYRHVRQALALDEHRNSFLPRPYLSDNIPVPNVHGQTLVQRWFPGAHCDVGGGFAPEESFLSHQAYQWLLSEAIAHGLRCAGVANPLPSTAQAKVARVHSQIYDQPLWALLGLTVRNPHQALDENDQPQAIRPEAQPTPAGQQLRFPQDTVWATPRPLASLLWGLLGAAAFFWLNAYALWGDSWCLGGMHLSDLSDMLRANCAFVAWQLTAWSGAAWPLSGTHSTPGAALLADVGLIASYTWVLARGMSHAFARLAGLRHIDSPLNPWLNRLGKALPILVVGDLVENLLTWWALPPFAGGTLWGHAVYGLMALASLIKFAGLGMVLALLVWGWLPQRKEK